MRELYRESSTFATLLLTEQGAIVTALYTPPADRGRGCARRVMRAVLADADRPVWLSLQPYPDTDEHRLRCFYRSLGFRRHSQHTMVCGPRLSCNYAA